MTGIEQVPVAQIVPGDNDRQTFDQVALQELADSIGEHGLAQPITVRPIWLCTTCGHRDADAPLTCERCSGDSLEQRFEIVAGERRFRAALLLGWQTIPAIVREGMSDEAASAVMLAENTSRVDLNPIDEARAYQARIDKFAWTVAKVAGTAGVSPELIRRRLTLLHLVPEIQHLVANGHFPLGHAETASCLDTNRQRIAVRIYNESKNGLPVAAFRGIVNQLLEEQSQEGLFDLEHFWVEQVQTDADLPRRGRRAVTGAPIRHDLPAVDYPGKVGAAGYIELCIEAFMSSGLEAEASALGTVYDRMVHLNLVAVPMESLLRGMA